MPSPINQVIAFRREQLWFRAGFALCVGVFYGPLLGWRITLAWVAAYEFLQVLEVFCVGRQNPWLDKSASWREPAALALICANGIVFGGLAMVEALRMGVWGQAFAAYLLFAALYNAVLFSIRCRGAFLAAMLPLAVYCCALPVIAALAGEARDPRIPLTIGCGSLLLVLNGSRLWREWSQAKAAEVAAIARDLAQREANEARLYRLAHTDTLTGLANRAAVQNSLRQMIALKEPGALLLIDLDSFKFVNDTFGHSAGDEALRDIGGRVASVARACDVTARLGGDEFAILLPGVTETSLALEIGERIILAISAPVAIDGQQITIGASIGVARYPAHGGDVEELFSNADLALYQAKADHGHCARSYAPALRAEAHAKLSRDNEVALALDRGEFELFYQPQIRLADRSLAGAEALLRWRHPEQGLLTPASFLPALEGGRLAALVGDWVTDTACRQAAIWRHEQPDFSIAINLFGAQFRSGNFLGNLTDTLARYGLDPGALEIEITENVILRHEDAIVTPLRALRDIGIGIAFDDYGTGYASLSLLKRYPLTRLKIDRNFTEHVCESPTDAAIVRAVVSMARAFDLAVIAEGIETEEQAAMMYQCGCGGGQGYLFGRPMPASEFHGFFQPSAALLG
jgi:diguanylate cyclase (GGDEF)-like protein